MGGQGGCPSGYRRGARRRRRATATAHGCASRRAAGWRRRPQTRAGCSAANSSEQQLGRWRRPTARLLRRVTDRDRGCCETEKRGDETATSSVARRRYSSGAEVKPDEGRNGGGPAEKPARKQKQSRAAENQGGAARC